MSVPRYYGLVKDTPDREYPKHVYKDHEIPSFGDHDLSKYVSKVYDQAPLGSCSANALCAAYLIDLRKEEENDDSSLESEEGNDDSYLESEEGNDDSSLESENESELRFKPSRLFLYYNSRKASDKKKDNGASICDTVEAFHKFGVCSENDWSYDSENVGIKPPQHCFRDATKTDIEYKCLNHDLHQLRACISDSCPFVFGMVVFESFRSKRVAELEKGNLCMPSAGERSNLCMLLAGGHEKSIIRHAVVAVAYDDREEKFKCLNSWGEDWGDAGYFYMPYEFITDRELCFDIWKISFSSYN